jgi:hypothetical protein
LTTAKAGVARRPRVSETRGSFMGRWKRRLMKKEKPCRVARVILSIGSTCPHTPSGGFRRVGQSGILQDLRRPDFRNPDAAD